MARPRNNPGPSMVMHRRTPWRSITPENEFLRDLQTALSEWAPTIFIGSSSEGLSVARKIRARLQSFGTVRLWTSDRLFRPSRVVFEELVRATEESEFAILVATSEDRVYKRGEPVEAMRDNVLFEFGLFVGSLGRERTFLLLPKRHGPSLPSDLQGLIYIGYGDSAAGVGRAGRALGRAIEDSVRSHRRAMMQQAHGFLRSRDHRAARRLQFNVEWIAGIFERFVHDLRHLRGPHATLHQLKRRAAAAVERFRHQSHRQVKVLHARKEADELATVLKKAIHSVPDFRTLGVEVGPFGLRLSRHGPERLRSRHRRAKRRRSQSMRAHSESLVDDLDEATTAMKRITGAYGEWVELFERQISDATLKLRLAISQAFDRVASRSLDAPHAVLTQWMWREYERTGRSDPGMKLAVSFGARNLSPAPLGSTQRVQAGARQDTRLRALLNVRGRHREDRSRRRVPRITKSGSRAPRAVARHFGRSPGATSL